MSEFRELCRIDIPLSEESKFRLTSFLIDWAEKKPSASGQSIISQLQSRRKSEKEFSEKAYNRTRPPGNTELEFLAIRVYEIYHVEQFNELYEDIHKLFPDLSKHRAGLYFENFIKKATTSISIGSWLSVGYLYRDEIGLMGINVKRKLPELHPLINYVVVEIKQTLPSQALLTFDVILREEASEKLNAVQSKRYFHQSKIEHIYLNGLPLGMSLVPPSNIQRMKVLDWLMDIRQNIQNVISGLINGGFFLNQLKTSKLIPAIEIFSISGTNEDISAWIEDNRHWWGSYSFSTYYGNLFSDGRTLFCWREKSSFSEKPIANRILIFKKSFVSDSKREEINISRDLSPFLNTINGPVANIEMMGILLRQLGKVRGKIYSRVSSKKFKINQLSEHTRLYQVFRYSASLVERFSLELEQNRKFINKELSESDKFLAVDVYSQKEAKKNRNFASDIIKKLEYYSDLLNSHMDFIDETFSTFIQIQNIDSANRMQRASNRLAWIASFVGALSLITAVINLLLYTQNNNVSFGPLWANFKAVVENWYKVLFELWWSK